MIDPGPGQTDDRPMLGGNLAALYRGNLPLAAALDAEAEQPLLPIEPTRSGQPTCRLPDADGRAAYLHSRYDPIKEAETLAADAGTDRPDCFVCVGLGLGYHVRLLAERTAAESLIVVVEPDLALLRTALSVVDFSEWIAQRRLLFVTSLDKGKLHGALQPIAALLMLGMQFVIHPALNRLRADFTREAIEAIRAFVEYSKISLQTLVGNNRITCRNVANNLPTYVAAPGLDILRDRFAGHPAIVISAGPSLARNVHLLAGAKGRAVLIATQPMLGPLLELGIRPDFVTSLDYHEVSGQFFEGIPPNTDVCLVAEPKATWRVVDAYRGPTILLGNELADTLLRGRGPRRARLRAGATVAHLAFYLAEFLGADPICFVGQDLSYAFGMYYFPGAATHRVWAAECNRFQTLESKEFHRLATCRGILVATRDIHGDPVYTNEQLRTYQQQFERDFAATAATVIDATEGGVAKAGAETMPLAEALARYAAEPIPPERFDYLSRKPWLDPAPAAEAVAALRENAAELGELEEICRQSADCLERMEASVEDLARMRELFVEMDRLRTRVDSLRHAYSLANEASQLAILQRISRDRRIGGGKEPTPDRQKQQIARDLQYVRSLADGCREMRAMIEASLERFAVRPPQRSNAPQQRSNEEAF